jgi:hypothetical protein
VLRELKEFQERPFKGLKELKGLTEDKVLRELKEFQERPFKGHRELKVRIKDKEPKELKDQKELVTLVLKVHKVRWVVTEVVDLKVLKGRQEQQDLRILD